MLEYAVDARATENKKKIIHYHIIVSAIASVTIKS